MKSILLFCSFVLIHTNSFSQLRYEKVFYHPLSAENGDLEVRIDDGVSNDAMTKFKLRLVNKSTDMLLFKAEESRLTLNGQSFVPQERPMLVRVADSESKVINFRGADFRVPSYSYRIEGLYRFSVNEQKVTAPDFLLPPSQNEFKAGNFTCTMLGLSKETDQTSVRFECIYHGDKIGVIHLSRPAVKLPDGQEVANTRTSARPVVLLKGESDKFTLNWDRMQGGKATDMQKINMSILWRDTFVESQPVKLAPISLDLRIDESKSK